MPKTYTSNNLIDIDKNLPPNLLMHELIVDFSNDPFDEMKNNLIYNETLSKGRKKFENNVCIIYKYQNK